MSCDSTHLEVVLETSAIAVCAAHDACKRPRAMIKQHMSGHSVLFSLCCTGTPVAFSTRRVPSFFTSSVKGWHSGSSTPALCAASFNCAMATDIWSVPVAAADTERSQRETTQLAGPKSVEDPLRYLPKL